MKKYSILLLLTLFVASCGGGGDDDDEPVVSKDYINVVPNLSLLPEGSVETLTINANCKWTITSSKDWLTVSPSSGSNSETVKVSAGKNSTGAERTAELTVKGGNAPTRYVMVTQPKSSDSQETPSSGEPSADDNQPPT